MVTHENNLGQYDYDLPQHLIAHRPSVDRENARLLVYGLSSGKVYHARIGDLATFISKEQLLVFNNTKVFAARVKGHKISGGEAEIFFLRPEADEDGLFEVLIKARGKKNIGDLFKVNHRRFSIVDILEEGFKIQFEDQDVSPEDLNPTVPIPPYIRGGVADDQDLEDYQTKYAKHLGSIAAPTAGLHFNKNVMNKLKEQQILKAEVTLHVGLGTFSPIRSENITEHKMHSEQFFIEKDDLDLINKYEQNIIAVGTTTLRVLESTFTQRMAGQFQADKTYETDIFLYPGKEIKSIAGLMTNFHLPKSSLLLLLCCYIGKEQAMDLYKQAIEKEYRFFSYGDAMLCLRDL